MEKHNSAHNFRELIEAFNEGFTESFITTANGLLICMADSCRFYDLDEIIISPPISLPIPATLFRIETKDGLWKGTFIDWEY